MTNKIKISKNQWLVAGVKKGYLEPNDDGTFTLKKEAIASLGTALAPLVSTNLRAGLSGAVVGGLGSLLKNTTLIERAKDWWNSGKETPEMLQSLMNARDQYDKNIKQLLNRDSSPVSERLSQTLNAWRKHLDTTIQKITQSLTERGIGPAQMTGQKMLEDEKMLEAMRRAAQMPPHNPSDISQHLQSQSTSTSTSAKPTSATATTGSTPTGSSSGASSSSSASAEQQGSGMNPVIKRIVDTAPKS
jgi:hypothetical protein